MHVLQTIIWSITTVASCIAIMLLYTEPSDFYSHCTSPTVSSLIPAYAIGWKWKKSTLSHNHFHHLESHVNHVGTFPRSFKGQCSTYTSIAIALIYYDMHEWYPVCIVRVWYNNPYHTRTVIPHVYTRMVCTICVWYRTWLLTPTSQWQLIKLSSD